MVTIAQRLAIFTLMMTVFAVGFSALVASADRGQKRIQVGVETSCRMPGAAGCFAVL